MRHTHQRPGPRGFRGDITGQAWADASEGRGARGRRGGFGAHDETEGLDGPHGRGRGRHGGPGRGGPGGPGAGRGRGRGRGGGRSRGDVRVAVLLLLADQPRHGYELIREIEERSGGAWVPSPGSIYPTLQSLEDEGLVAVDTVEGRKVASLTPAGDEWAEAHAGELDALFEVDDREQQMIALRRELDALRDAVHHVMRHDHGTEVAAKAVDVVGAARRDLYRLLADADG
ncbi:PadR family transcriptional regulator [Demequina sp. SYSU T00192]|uniref:PadR family transcriptional regulator n=1 Tax=Demequina litoralis TaxID=3051660 RepID=A0ABT8G6E0_9MICO|nr:PadR family transcriptional regulator [Demequina sp. SYSU T00192]MDN4474692.1 PadR family transcriptional regulator [Demequina sp. SYSU T00192]